MAYFQSLRDRWQAIKDSATAGEIDAATAAIATHGLQVSPWSYMFTAASMRAQGLEGIPYLDTKTFQGWRAAGFMVRKGEKSTLSGITWVSVKGKDGAPDDDGYMYPKEYHLFHRSQVDAIV